MEDDECDEWISMAILFLLLLMAIITFKFCIGNSAKNYCQRPDKIIQHPIRIARDRIDLIIKRSWSSLYPEGEDHIDSKHKYNPFCAPRTNSPVSLMNLNQEELNYYLLKNQEELNLSLHGWMKYHDTNFIIDESPDEIMARINDQFDYLEPPRRIKSSSFQSLSKYSWVKYNDLKIISDSPYVLEGLINDQIKVAIEKSEKFGKCQMESTIEVAELLNHHSNFLTHFSILPGNCDQWFVIKELYTTNLWEFGMFPHKFTAAFVDLKEVSSQISSALLFCKKSTKIIFNNINPRNIAVSIRHDRHPIYKISDFSEADFCKDEMKFKIDVKGLGSSLLVLRKNMQTRQLNWSTYEDTLLSDVILSTTLNYDVGNFLNFHIEELCDHPYTWDTKRTLNLFLQASKLLESNSRQSNNFRRLLKRNVDAIVSENWTQFLEKEVMKELNRILREKSSSRFTIVRCEIFDLIKTIRNLVKFSYIF